MQFNYLLRKYCIRLNNIGFLLLITLKLKTTVCFYQLLFDFSETSHPISVPVNVPDEINEIFDTISYQKGGSVIRMMANFLQINTFNRGITNYLHNNAYGNANQVESIE